MEHTVVNLFSPRGLSKIQKHGIDMLKELTPCVKEHCVTNNIDIFKKVVTQQYNTESILQYEEMSPTQQCLWFALCNRKEYFKTAAIIADENPVLSIHDKMKSLYKLLYSANTRISALLQCLRQINIPEYEDSIGCDLSTKKMIKFYYETIRFILEGLMTKSDLKEYVNKSKISLKYTNRQSKNDDAIFLAEEYVDNTQLDSLLFQTVLRLILIFEKYSNLSFIAYIFAPGVLHFFFNYSNDKYTILEITDRFTFLHQETTDLVYFLKTANEAFNNPGCSSHSWWDISLQSSYHYSVYSPLGIKVILAPIKHNLTNFTLVTLGNIEHALERSRLRGEFQLGFVDQDYQVVNLKNASVEQWEEISMWFMAPFIKMRGLSASYDKELWTQKHSMWIASATVLLFIGSWANISEIVEESILKLMPIEIKLFTGPVVEKCSRPIKSHRVLLPITIKNCQIHVSGVYGDCMVTSKNGHWRHLTKEVLFFLILCRKFHVVKIWLLNVNSKNNKTFVRSLHPLLSASYKSPTEVKLSIFKKTITEDYIIEYTARLLKGIEREAWSIVRELIPNSKPIFSDELRSGSNVDG